MSNKLLLNLLNSFKTSKQSKLSIIEIKFSKKILNVSSILLKEGLIRGYFLKNCHIICILLKYVDDENIVTFKNNSSLNQKVYYDNNAIKNNFMSFNSSIVSTRKGVLSHKDVLNKRLGGFVLLKFF
jgi:ribosomal protein S8